MRLEELGLSEFSLFYHLVWKKKFFCLALAITVTVGLFIWYNISMEQLSLTSIHSVSILYSTQVRKLFYD